MGSMVRAVWMIWYKGYGVSGMGGVIWYNKGDMV